MNYSEGTLTLDALFNYTLNYAEVFDSKNQDVIKVSRGRLQVGRDGVVGIDTRYELDGSRIESW